MWKALLVKEFRQSLWITLPALVVYIVFILEMTRIPIVPSIIRPINNRNYEIPFVGDQIRTYFGIITGILAAILGFWQSLGESRLGTYAILLHLPLPRKYILGFKFLWGIICVLGFGSVVLCILSVWAATPGTHPSPFRWSMTWPSWWMLATQLLIYFGVFLSGLRPASWFGSRLFPAILAIAIVLCLLTSLSLPLLFSIWLISSAGFSWVIFDTMQERDFS